MIEYKKFFKDLLNINKNRYEYKNNNNKKWAYISYIPRVYYKKKDSPWFLRHQNRREAIEIGKVFMELGYNFVMTTYNRSEECDNRKYDIIFGLEPNFVTMAKRNPNAIKIFYATEAYSPYQAKAVRDRTDQFNLKHNVKLKYSRTKEKHESHILANYILQIGTKSTLSTYPEELQEKIHLINQSSNNVNSIDIDEKLNLYNRKEFIWLGSDGSILKGLDLILDYFIDNQDLSIHVIGKIDDDFLEFYKPRIINCPNIHIHGFLDLQSEKFKNIVNKVTFTIFPSASEGCPGSTIALMYEGVIPIVSKVASFEDIDQWGYVINELSEEGVKNAILWAKNLSDSSIRDMIANNISYSRKRWNLDNFKVEFYNYIQEVTKNCI
jgi:hypothetical protein